MTTAEASPGWYPDPEGRFTSRFFDGRAWTADVIDAEGRQANDDARARPPRSLPMTTAEGFGDRAIRATLGICFGVSVRSPGTRAALGSLSRGITYEYDDLLAHSRHEALSKMSAHAAHLGAEGVVGVRFDSSALNTGTSEVVAYGTAVTFEPPGGDQAG